MLRRVIGLTSAVALAATLVIGGATGAAAGKLVQLGAQLSGTQVIPGPGDPDGTAFARFVFASIGLPLAFARSLSPRTPEGHGRADV